MNSSRHIFDHGRLAYLQIPALDVNVSAAFYQANFHWQIRGQGTEHLGFSDASGDTIGAWVTGRAISASPGVLAYIYVHGIDAALAQITASGGDIVTEPYAEGDLWVARFRDPAGNVLGIWQQAPR
ncbi:VOC family protein [Dyella silvatica]|uniref:VOC family protein n=1 Tax=Dyella silvatica TaxID=2992128 RepID=UPI002259376E|nr:VOC family protein [Dyella silvatica]